MPRLQVGGGKEDTPESVGPGQCTLCCEVKV